jgi:hypothetical protein
MIGAHGAVDAVDCSHTPQMSFDRKSHLDQTPSLGIVQTNGSRNWKLSGYLEHQEAALAPKLDRVIPADVSAMIATARMENLLYYAPRLTTGSSTREIRAVRIGSRMKISAERCEPPSIQDWNRAP